VIDATACISLFLCGVIHRLPSRSIAARHSGCVRSVGKTTVYGPAQGILVGCMLPIRERSDFG